MPISPKHIIATLIAPRYRAHAHSGRTSYINVSIRVGGVSGEVQYPIHDINHVLGLSIPEEESGGLAAMEANLAAIQAYTSEHFAIGDGDVTWPVEFTGYRILDHDHGGYAIVKYRVPKTFDGTPPQLSVTFDGIIHQYPDREALVVVKTSRGFGELRAKAQDRLPISASIPTQQVLLQDPSIMSNVAGAATAATIRAKRFVRRLIKKG